MSFRKTDRAVFALCLLVCTALTAQQIPPSDALPGKPFFIKNTWTIGGEGPWDSMVTDPGGTQLFVAHGRQIQVVDLSTGTVTGQVTGLNEAHGIALDDNGQVGYIGDGPAAKVRVFDQRTFAVVASISTGPNPGAVVFEPATRLVFAVSASALPPPPGAKKPNDSRAAPVEPVKSAITVINSDTRTVLGNILLPGRLGSAQAGANGEVYVSIVDRSELVRLDAQMLVSQLRHQRADNGQPAATILPVKTESEKSTAGAVVDLSELPHPPQSPVSAARFFPLGSGCQEQHGLAVDGRRLRLFATCANMRLMVLNSDTGSPVASLPIGPGAPGVAYDANRGLIYAANGGGDGSLTVIRQDVTDSYAVIQTLPTRQRADTVAVNPANGDVYLVTDTLGIDLEEPARIGSLKMIPAPGSFQVLVVGN